MGYVVGSMLGDVLTKMVSKRTIKSSFFNEKGLNEIKDQINNGDHLFDLYLDPKDCVVLNGLNYSVEKMLSYLKNNSNLNFTKSDYNNEKQEECNLNKTNQNNDLENSFKNISSDGVAAVILLKKTAIQ